MSNLTDKENHLIIFEVIYLYFFNNNYQHQNLLKSIYTFFPYDPDFIRHCIFKYLRLHLYRNIYKNVVEKHLLGVLFCNTINKYLDYSFRYF